MEPQSTDSLPVCLLPNPKLRHDNNFKTKAMALRPKDKVPGHIIETFLACVRAVSGGNSQVRKKGSRRTGTAIRGSDFDYHLETPTALSTANRDKIIAAASKRGLSITCKKAFTVRHAGGPSIDFFPPEAEWHDDVQVEAPLQPLMDQGRKNAIRKLKALKAKRKDALNWQETSSKELEELVLQVQREKTLDKHTDPSGERRFSEAQRRISAGLGLKRSVS